MKKILISSCLVLIMAWQANAQGRRFNSPNNYFGIRPEYKDTLIIDLNKGQKIEFIYNWYDLFRDDDEKFEKYFWKPFETNLNLLSEKIHELEFDNKNKYHITLKTWRDRTNITKRMQEFYSQYKKEDIEEKSKQERDSIHKYRFSKMWEFVYPRKYNLHINIRKDINKTREFQIEDNKLVSQTQWQHILEINYNSWKVRFYVNNLEDLKTVSSYNLKQLIRNEKDNFMKKQYYRFHTKLNYVLKDDKLVQQSSFGDRKKIRTRHMSLNFYPQIGTSLVKGKFSADMGALLGMNFNHKQNGAIRISMRYQLKAFGKGDDNTNSVRYNGFLDGIMDMNIGENYKREQWVGAGIGYLIHQEGNIYGENTARIFLKYRSSQMWGIQPEFNYSFKENNGFIGLGVYFSL
nr:hypothetical protein [uncultured Marinifilum sp.]